MNSIKNIKRSIAVFIAAMAIAVISVISSASPVSAGQVVVANMNDVYSKMRDASKLLLAANAFRLCFEGNHIAYQMSAAEAKAGKIFDGSNTNVAVPLWLEYKIQGKYQDGSVYCDNGQSDSKSIFHQFANAIGVSNSQIVCNGGANGMLANYTYELDSTYGEYTYVKQSKNCSQFDSTFTYGRATEWENHLKTLLDQYREKNEFLAPYSAINAYLPIDGYFNYLEDFNAYCADSANGPILAGQEENATDYQHILRADQNGTTINFHRYSYHMTSDKSWTYSITGAKNGDRSKCSGLLNRIEELQFGDNYSDFSTEFQQLIDSSGRDKGSYFDVLVAQFKETCANLTTNDGTSSWAEMKDKLQEVIDDQERSEDVRKAAQENLDKITAAEQKGDYTEWIGDEDAINTAEGRTLQCLDIEGMQILLDEFLSGLDSDPANSHQASCMDQAGSLGWIVCPLVNSLADAIQSIYNKYIVPFLRIDVGLLDENGSGQNVYNAWRIFQNIANLAFVALLFVIIFSQLTGFGIDNYGIKKTLPKLIIGALLINLSFLICALAVDLSNIVGYGVGTLFDSIGESASISGIQVQSAPGGGGVVLTVVAGATAGIGLFAIVASFFSNPVLLSGGGIGLIMPILMCLLTVFLGILFTFILLSMRQALAVVLVIISPLAFACYMLPNTKGLFDKWFKGLKALLITFPIASALIYGGQAIGKILITAGGSSSQTSTELVFSAAIVAIAPVFMIPSIVRSSMMGIAELGNAMNNLMGRRRGLQSGIRGGLEKSRLGGYTKDMMSEAQRRKMLNRVSAEQKRLEKKRQNGGLKGYEAKRYQRNATILEREGDAEVADLKQQYGIMSQGSPTSSDPGWGDATLLGMFSTKGLAKGEFVDKKGELDFSKVQAAMSSIGKGKDRIAAFNALSQTDAYKKAMSTVAGRQKMAQIMGAGGTEIENGIADTLRKSALGEGQTSGENYTFDKIASESKGLASYLSDQGTDIASSITKHDMAEIKDENGNVIYDIRNQLSAEQKGALMSAGMTGDREEALGKMVDRMVESGSVHEVSDALATIKAENASGITNVVTRQAGSKLGATTDQAAGQAVRGALVNASGVIEADTTGAYRGKLHSVLGGAFGGGQQPGGPQPQPGNPQPGGGGDWRKYQSGN